MSGIKQKQWRPVLSLALGLFISVPAQAAPYPTQGIAYQQASFQSLYQPQHYQHKPVSVAPEILPYVPFTSESQVISPQLPRHVRSQASTWRQQPATPNRFHLAPVRQKILAMANRQLGVKYRWGGNSPREGFDCSGFTKYTLKHLDIKIPRTAAQQSRASRTISRQELRPGDLIFFKTKGRRVNHVGIYLGNGRFIHAASGGGKVMTDDLRKNYWQKRLFKYGTFLG